MNWEQINDKRRLSAEKYKFYRGTYDYADFSKGQMARTIQKSRLGWGARAVEIRGNKTVFDCFENDALGFNRIAREYHVYEAFNKIKEDILVAGCGFFGLVGKRVLPFTAEEASGVFDWEEQNLSFGAAAFSDAEKQKGLRPIKDERPKECVVYSKDRTEIWKDGEVSVVANPTGRPLMGLLTYRATTKQPMGASVLTSAAREAIVDASRTNHQAMIAAHYYNVKVNAILGADVETDVEKVEGQTGDILKISPNADGNIPQIGEFAQHSMAPFKDTIEIAAQNFCSATKLVLSNLSRQSNAPQSPEALEIVSDDLRDDIAEWHREIGEQIKYFCMTIFMLENGISEIDKNLQTQYDAILPVFKPIYRADVAKVGDGVYKLAEKAPGVLLSRQLWRNLGLASGDIDMIIESVKNNPA